MKWKRSISEKQVLCSIHYIRAVTLNQLVLRHIQGALSYIQQFEAVFVKKKMEKASTERELSVEKAKVGIVTLKRRDEGLDTLFKRIYEDMVSGRLSAERFDKLFSKYETEQKNVKAAILDLQELIDSGKQEQHDLQQFLKNVRKYTDPQELTAEILNDLVDKIVMHAPDKSSGKQKIEIYYKSAGIINNDLVLPMTAERNAGKRKLPKRRMAAQSFDCTASLT